jgi:hypothetical protein
MAKYRGRKIYSEKEAKDNIETLKQSLWNSLECIGTWQRNIATWKRDYLIEALCHKSHEQMIDEEIETIEFIRSKIEYMQKFL